MNNKYNKGGDFKKTFNHDYKKKKDFKKKFEEKDKFDPVIEVRNGNVEQAIRVLKKRLLKADRQKELAKREYYEKPSAKRKRVKDQEIRRHKKELLKKIQSGSEPYQETGGLKHLKGKRSRRKHAMLKDMFSRANRRR